MKTAEQNYFELFGQSVGFDIDLANITETYRDLQRSVHPDRFANATDRERRISMQKASLINEAFRTLKDPLQRARYMLTLQGIDTNDETNTIMDGAFLMQQMELREALADIGNKAEPLQALDEFVQDVALRISKTIERLAEFLQIGDEQSNQQAFNLTMQMQFLYKLRDEAEEREEMLL